MRSIHSEICAGLKSYEVSTTETTEEGVVDEKVQVTPKSSHLYQCSAQTGERCQFPFGLKGEKEVRWSCVGEESQCSPGSNDATSSWTTDDKLRFFDSQRNFHKCVDCNLSGVPCHLHGVAFLGFPLATFAGNSPFSCFVLQLSLAVLKGKVSEFVFYRSNLVFWIVMGCGTADFGQRGL